MSLTSEQKWGLSLMIGGFAILLFNPVTFQFLSAISTILGGMRIDQGDWIGVIILAIILVLLVRFLIW